MSRTRLRWRSLLPVLMAALLPLLASAAPAPDLEALSARQIREDFELAVAAVETGLPDITWFQSAQAWRVAKRDARASLSSARDADGLFRVLRPLLSQIGEGHLTLQRSAAMQARDREATGLLPLDTHWTADGTWVTAGWGEAADIAPGTRLLAIDGEPVERLLDASMLALGHDGAIRTGVMRDLGGAGYAKVRYWMRGSGASYRLLLEDAAGHRFERQVPGIDTSLRPAPKSAARSPLATLTWLSEHTALLEVPTFSNRRYREAGSDYKTVIHDIFEQLQTRTAQTLILDLRGNGGGSEGNENALFSYLVPEPLRKYAAVEARGERLSIRDAQGRRYMTEVYDAEELQRQQGLPGGGLSRRNVPPDGLMSHWEAQPLAFTGRLIVLAGGNTFSGAAELSSMLYQSRRALFIGEEVAGAHAGNTSGYRWDVELPNSHMQLHVPLLRFRFAWDELPLGRGVMPHCAVAPDLPGSGVDTALALAKALAVAPWTTTALPDCRVFSE